MAYFPGPQPCGILMTVPATWPDQMWPQLVSAESSVQTMCAVCRPSWCSSSQFQSSQWCQTSLRGKRELSASFALVLFFFSRVLLLLAGLDGEAAGELPLDLMPGVGVASSDGPGAGEGEVEDGSCAGAVIVTAGVAGAGAGCSSRTVISLCAEAKEVTDSASELSWSDWGAWLLVGVVGGGWSASVGADATRG
jgi:hypothetical protein